ncbi:MAG TPA: single-stranded-DNA-specific exonuclease RecJ [Candidatus Paceibacterota bacterium]|nr:single-stranded-DNA-specific exonuclease RecJ [Candidatus Paceibacterota bacterium]HOL53919.1 single-stranded-DNA-specific exonuclease RecJ [Candidatus Paceibacterota bacterium]HON21589.1 single-stranded-DNA-specific exonuclease RecJ [Candidatus Paceibacterota bacterium]HPP16809.1 single-stranded-DNA-specific exonuclease RecJ [Candidatus Paceibacterota bacterium]HRU33652.1 single-stranded-DNA-specific exonuclease RecJ [Candidatus Paceibacterota bacterium]
MKEMQWKIREPMPVEFAKSFPEFNRPILQLFWNRNLRTKESIYKFLNPVLHNLYHPREMLNMEMAVQRINEAMKNNEKIAIYGDYDTDGVCSTTILARTFKILNYQNFDVYIPNRFKGGYGLTKDKIEKMHQRKTQLVITLDCGITDAEEVALAKKLGMEVIIFDHHLIGAHPPETLIVDPWQKDDRYPFKDLVASGISYKLAMFLMETNHHPLKPIFEKQFLDLVAIATIADVAPLIDENRIFVSEGLKQLVKTQNIGLRKLLEIAGLNLKTKLDPYHVGFIIAPRLNAVGRIEHQVDNNFEETDYSFELLMTENENEAEFLAQKVNDLNLERQNKVQEIYDHIKKELSQQPQLDKIICLGNPHWSKGVVGIVAGKLKDEFGRPVFIYSEGKEISTGSARSVNGFNLVELIERHRDLFIEAGGHRLAAGFSLKNENLERFKEALQKESAQIRDEDLIPKLIIDTTLDPDEITPQFLEIFYRLEPFGRENPEPVFLMSDVIVSDVRIVGNGGNHIKFSAQKKNRYFNVISFNNAEQLKFLTSGTKADIVFSLTTDEWGGQQFLEFQLLGIKEK